jgi:hypothetical protein
MYLSALKVRLNFEANITGKKREKQRLIHGIGEPRPNERFSNITSARGIERVNHRSHRVARIEASAALR